MSKRDRFAMRDWYDSYGEREWARLEQDVRGRVSFEVHRRFLGSVVKPGMRVLEVGAGPGRFTDELAELGTRVVVTDFSPVQLELNRKRMAGTPADDAVEARELLDVCDTSRYHDGAFDAVVAFGGPLSYAFEQAEAALAGLFRVTRPGGPVVASVMSLLGTWRYFLPGVVADTERMGEDANDAVLRSGDLRHFGNTHVCRMFRSRDVAAMVHDCGAEVTAMSASHWTSLGDEEALSKLEANPQRWRRYLEHEVAACAEPGALDGGLHLLFAAARTV